MQFVLDLVEAYQKYKTDIFTYIYLRVNKRRDIAEDIFQETFLKALKYRSKYNPGLSNPRTWLTTIAKNLVTDYYKSKYKHLESTLDENFDIADDADDNIDVDIMYSQVVNILDKMNEKDKELIILRYVNEFDLDEIASMMGMSYDSVKVAVNRAIQKLRRLI